MANFTHVHMDQIGFPTFLELFVVQVEGSLLFENKMDCSYGVP